MNKFNKNLFLEDIANMKGHTIKKFLNEDEFIFIYLCYIQEIFKKLLAITIQEDVSDNFLKASIRNFLSIASNLVKVGCVEDKLLKIGTNYLSHGNCNKDYFTILQIFYNILETARTKINKKFITQQIKIKPKKFDIVKSKSDDIEKYKPLGTLKKLVDKNLTEYIEDFIIQGSYGDFKTVDNWSDLDIVIILKKKIFDHKLTFIQAQRIFKKISLSCYFFDILAHHRFNFISPFDASFYSQTSLPVDSFSDAISLFNKEHDLTIRENYFDGLWKLDNFLKYFDQRRKNNYCEDLYIYKNSLSMLMLTPSLLLQAKGVNVSKKKSFSLCRETFTNLNYSIIEFASTERLNWRLKNNGLLFLLKYIDKIPYFFLDKFIKGYKKAYLYRHKNQLNKIEFLNIEAKKFLEQGLALLKNR